MKSTAEREHNLEHLEKEVRTMKTMLSGIQPSGILTLGNYLGALRNWRDIQYEYNCIYFVADLHSITQPQDPEILRENTKKVILQYAACGIDFDNNIVFLQSQVHEHAELGWLLNCYTNMGELQRMTQYKDKSRKQRDKGNSVLVGLFDYPVLMAADILLYDSDFVPVGDDQRQHLELTRDVAARFNSKYGDIFTIPDGYYTESGARVMSLQNPEEKMSKSDDNSSAYITLLDPKDVIIKKFKRAVTDSGNEVRYSDDKPGIKNLINIYAATANKTVEEIEREFDGLRYGDFKLAVGEVVSDLLGEIQKCYTEFSSGEKLQHLSERLETGAHLAHTQASAKLAQCYEAVGFMRKLQ